MINITHTEDSLRKALTLLKILEWSRYKHYSGTKENACFRCPICNWRKIEGHGPKCKMNKDIKYLENEIAYIRSNPKIFRMRISTAS